MNSGIILSHYDGCVLVTVEVHVGGNLDHHQPGEGSHPGKESINKLEVTLASVHC